MAMMMTMMMSMMTMMMGFFGSRMGGGDPMGQFGNQFGNQMGLNPGGCGCGMPFNPGYSQNYGNGMPGYSAPGAWGPSNAPAMGPGDFCGNSAFGNRLASDAYQIARSGVAGSGGNCKRGVRMALERQGVSLHGLSAYQGADQLARNPRFREVQVSREQLRQLPPGAVVVWNKGNGRPHGHISISLGNGREASDVIRNQITGYGTSYRVFLPR